MKIALIMTKGNIYSFKNRSFLFKYMPDSLTMGTLHAIIKKNFPETEIEIYDETVETVSLKDIRADLIGISAITASINKAYKYSEYFRKKNIPVFIGGVHATLYPDEVLKHCDAVIQGLADETLPQLIKDYQKKELKQIYKQPETMSFDNLVFPSRHIYEEKNFFATELNMVYATFGCQNMCEFCVQPYVCNGYHQRPVDEVAEEIKLIEDDYVEFVDPNLSKDKNYLKNLCMKLIPLNKQWFAPVTISICKDDELLELMKKAGCCEVLIGFESVNQDSVKTINKGFNIVEDYKECIKKLHSHKIKVTGSFVLGLDEDDESVFSNTLNFVNETGLDFVRYTINTPFPGTKYFEKMKNKNRISTYDWDLYDCRHCIIIPAKMSAETVENGYKWIWKETYSLKNIIRRLSYSDNLFDKMKLIIQNYIFGKIYIKMTINDNKRQY